MKQFFLGSLIYVLLISNLFGQQVHGEFGKLSAEDIDYVEFPDDPDAEAVVLYDKGESFFYRTAKGGYDIRFTRTRRIKILKESGSKHGQVEIRFFTDGYGRTESVKSIEAHTFNYEDGRVEKTSVPKSQIYEKKLNNYWSTKTFAFPNVKEGSIIEYKYVLETPFHFNLPDWRFQDVIPTVYSEYVVKMIPFYEYVIIPSGISDYDVQKSYENKGVSRQYGSTEFHDIVHIFGMKNVPAFKDESYITSVEDYIMKIDFQLSKFYSPTGSKQEIISTWPDLSVEFLKHEKFGKYIKKSRKLSKKVFEKLSIQGKEDIEKCKTIIDYVKQGYDWNRYYGDFASQNANSFYKTKSGNVADMNLFMLGLLQGANINAKPMILSTRRNGKINRNYPFADVFNYVVAIIDVDGTLFFADATDPNTSFNRLPTRCINDFGLILDEKDPSWANLDIRRPSLNNGSMKIVVDSLEPKARVDVSIQATEYESLSLRNQYEDNEDSLKSFFSRKGIRDVNKVKSMNFTEVEKPYILFGNGEIDLEFIGNKVLVSPFLKFPLSKNSLTEPKRDYPVDFVYPFVDSFISTVDIPEGYKLLEVPKDFELNDPLVRISLKYEVSDASVLVKGSYEFKKSIYDPGDYSRLKWHLNTIVKKFNDQIILESN